MEKPKKENYKSGISFPFEVAEQLKTMAAETNRSINYMLMECVTYYFKNVFKKDLK